jgi:hypothetical protein
MDKPVGNIVYDLEEVEKYIRQEENCPSINLLKYYKDNCRWFGGNRSYFYIDEFCDVDEVDMELEQWDADARLEYKNSKLIYKYFPDANYFNIR